MRYYIVKSIHGVICYQVPIEHVIAVETAFENHIISKGITLHEALTNGGFPQQAITLIRKTNGNAILHHRD